MAKRDQEGLSTRDRILLAAITMFGENQSASLSVRAVAARAQVSTGSLRHHFPTQRALQDAVLATIYDHVSADDRIHDRSSPARDRLLDCLRQVLAAAPPGEPARKAWGEIFHRFIEPDPTEEIRASYLAIGQEVHRRVEYWLTVLANEGALPAGDNARRARFLVTVVNGLSIERALPAENSILSSETETLRTAVDCVFAAFSAE